MKATRFTLLLAISLLLSAITATAHRTLTPQNPATKRIDTQTQASQIDPGPELRCRRGDPLRFVRNARTREDPATGELTFSFEITYFLHGKNPAGAQSGGLQPGECSWIDRAMNENEIYLRELIFYMPSSGDPQPDNSPDAAERVPNAENIIRYLRSPDHYWSFWGRVNGYQVEVYRHACWKKHSVQIPIQTAPRKSPLDGKKRRKK